MRSGILEMQDCSRVQSNRGRLNRTSQTGRREASRAAGGESVDIADRFDVAWSSERAKAAVAISGCVRWPFPPANHRPPFCRLVQAAPAKFGILYLILMCLSVVCNAGIFIPLL